MIIYIKDLNKWFSKYGQPSSVLQNAYLFGALQE